MCRKQRCGICDTEAPRVVVRRHYNTVVRTAQPAMLAATEKGQSLKKLGTLVFGPAF